METRQLVIILLFLFVMILAVSFANTFYSGAMTYEISSNTTTEEASAR